jgi:hypothetical protein
MTRRYDWSVVTNGRLHAWFREQRSLLVCALAIASCGSSPSAPPASDAGRGGAGGAGGRPTPQCGDYVDCSGNAVQAPQSACVPINGSCPEGSSSVDKNNGLPCEWSVASSCPSGSGCGIDFTNYACPGSCAIDSDCPSGETCRSQTGGFCANPLGNDVLCSVASDYGAVVASVCLGASPTGQTGTVCDQGRCSPSETCVYSFNSAGLGVCVVLVACQKASDCTGDGVVTTECAMVDPGTLKATGTCQTTGGTGGAAGSGGAPGAARATGTDGMAGAAGSAGGTGAEGATGGGGTAGAA